MDFSFGFSEEDHQSNVILVFVELFSKIVHLAAVNESISAHGCARVFIDKVFQLHGLPRELVSDRDPRFTATFWQSVFRGIRTRQPRPRRDTSKIRPIFHRLERIFPDGEVCYQQLHACIGNSYTIFRERLTPSTPTLSFRV